MRGSSGCLGGLVDILGNLQHIIMMYGVGTLTFLGALGQKKNYVFVFWKNYFQMKTKALFGPKKIRQKESQNKKKIRRKKNQEKFISFSCLEQRKNIRKK